MVKEKVKHTIKKYHLFSKRDKVVIGVSGGPDSVALLYVLHALQKELKISLHIAHMDHMLRGSSYKDREFVECLAKKLKIPITTTQMEMRTMPKRGSLEEACRKARLGFLCKTARRIKADEIALGHNFDDQAETVLMRILRGTGLYGLAGILPKRKIEGCVVVRPLIELRRSEIESFLRKKRIKARVDRTNLEDIFFRNKIRNRLLPLLEREYNTSVKKVLCNMAESIGYDYDYLHACAEGYLRRQGARLQVKRLLKLHPAIRRLVLRLKITGLQGDTRRITHQHIAEIEDLLLNRPQGSIVDLPKGVSVVKKNRSLRFYFRRVKSGDKK